jgi:hypothetical protein
MISYMTKCRLAGIYTAIAVVLVMVFSAPALSEVKRYAVPAEGSPVIGPEKAEITIIEFIDYQ